MSVNMQDNTQDVLDAMQTALHRGLEAVGLTAESYAKQLCPVDTGRLRNSITHLTDDDNKCEYIGTNVEYAPYVETNDSANHPTGQAHFLRNAASEHTDEYRKLIEDSYKNA